MKVMYRPLGEIVTFFGGGTPSKSRPEFYEGGSIPWITPKDMKSWIIDSSIDRITSEAMDQSTAKLIPAPGVLVVVRSGVLKHTLPVGINQVPVTVNQDMKALVCSNLVDPLYLGRFLRASAQSILTNVRGTTADNISTRVLKDLVVPLPPLAEQKRIAGILDAADALRAKRRESLAQLDTLLQSTFLDMFGDPVTNPMGWEVKELAEVVKEGTIVTYGIVQAGKEYPGGVPYIRTGDIIGGQIQADGLRHTDPAIAAKFGRSRVRTDEIVMSIRATVGTTAQLPPELDGANLTQGTARISPGEHTDPSFLLSFIRSCGCQSWLQRQIKGATFREITLKRLRQMPICVPPLDVQHRFAATVESVKQQKTRLRAHLTELDTLFASLQHRAFEGEL